MKLFISYAHDDQERVQEIVTLLETGGHDPWFDDSLMPGQDWQAVLLANIQACEAFVYMLSPAAVASEWCQWEYAQAIKHGKAIIPILLKANTNIPQGLSRYQYADFSAGATARNTAQLIGGIHQLMYQLSPTEAPAVPSPSGAPAKSITQRTEEKPVSKKDKPNISISQTATNSENVTQIGYQEGSLTINQGNVDKSIHIGGDVGPGAAIGHNAQVTAENIAGRDIIIGQGTTEQKLDDLIAALTKMIDNVPEENQEEAKYWVDKLEAEMNKGDEASENDLNMAFKRLKTLAKDMFEVAVATIAHPAAGFAVVAQKVAAKAEQAE